MINWSFRSGFHQSNALTLIRVLLVWGSVVTLCMILDAKPADLPSDWSFRVPYL